MLQKFFTNDSTEMYIADLLRRDWHDEDLLHVNNYQILFSILTTATGLKILQDL